MTEKPETKEEYSKLISQIIRKQVAILGPDVAILKAQKVEGLEVDEEGNVKTIEREPQQTLEDLIDQYVGLSGQIVKSAIKPLLADYPDLEIPSLANIGNRSKQ